MSLLKQNKPSLFRVLLQNLLLGTLARYAFRLKKTPISIKGLELIDQYKDRVVILAPNHQSYLDAPAIVQAAGVNRMRRFHALGWDGLFQNAFFGYILDILNVTPINQTNPMSIRRVLKQIKAGTSYVIFPEGERSPGEKFIEFKEGLAWLAKKAGRELDVVILPMLIQGSFRAFPLNGSWVGHPISIEIGRPLMANDFADRKVLMQAYRQEMNRLDEQVKNFNLATEPATSPITPQDSFAEVERSY